MTHHVYENGREVSGGLPFDLLRTESAGIFESMRVLNGRILHEEEHLARLLDSARTVDYRPFPGLAKLRQELRAALKAFGKKECFSRLTLWEGRVLIMLGFREHPKGLYEDGVVLKTASFPRGGSNAFPWQAKTSAYQQAILASTEPRPDKVYEWIFLDAQHMLTETRVGNFFIIRYSVSPSEALKKGGAMLLTPPEHLILNGVTRRFVIKCALELGIEVRELPLTRHEFFNADEAFICNTSWEVLPVRELDGRVIGSGKPGPVTLKLHRHFKRRIQKDVTPRHSPRPDQRFR